MMKKKRNMRTLKKRIRRVIDLSTLITVLFLSGVIIYLILVISKSFAASQAEIVSYSIQQEINSGSIYKPLGISKIDEIDNNNPKTRMWLEDLNRRARIDEFIPFASDVNKMYIRIEIKDKFTYSNEAEGSEELSDFYKDTQSVKPILDSNNNEIGSITVRVNPEYLLGIVIPLLMAIIFISFLALIISSILSRFLVIPIITPLKQLETKVKAIAEGDQETAVNTQIILKKPLREIESLADSTNGIMKKLKGYNELLENQKDALENQNSELEAQNEELIESKLEIQKQQAQLVQSEKMASVGLLTAAITHEINTPIGAINSNVQIQDMLLNELVNNSNVKSNEELSLMLGQLKEANDVNLMACSRIIEIIKSLKSFSRLDQADFQEANINEGIKSVLVLTNNLLKRRITVHGEFGDIPLVRCFPGQLNQVLMNIIVNASQAIEGEGDIFIKTYNKEGYIYISIKDTGAGIKEENITKLFDPGFTTKGVGVGLGLGLYISYNIIQKHKGEISVVSELGKGAEFIVKIPIDNDRT
jgi:signal transduction histidine kinase